jgi:hypothetical protein
VSLPRNLDEAAAFFRDLTPEDFQLLRLGLIPVLLVVAIVLVAWAVWRKAG